MQLIKADRKLAISQAEQKLRFWFNRDPGLAIPMVYWIRPVQPQSRL